jgi:hypothetical protein
MTQFNFLKRATVVVLSIGWATKLLAVPLTPEEVSQYATPAIAKFNYLHTRDNINQNHFLYNSNDSSLTVNVLFENIHEIFFTENLRIYINGRDISEINPFNFQLTKSPPVAPDIYGEVGGEVNVPIGLDINYPLVSLTAELIHDDTGVVLARNRIVMYETIWDSDIEFAEPNGEHEGYYYQLTGLGLGGESPHTFAGLETNVSDVFPAPSAEEFSATFSDIVAAIPSQQESELKHCIDYNELDDERFSDPQLFAPYQRAKTQANAIYAAYVACKTAGGGAVCRAACVKKPPKAKDFKLCVDTMTATPVDGRIDGPHSVQLEFLNSLRRDRAAIGADVLLQDITADVDITLSDLSVEWRKSGFICKIKPIARVQPEEIQSSDWLSAFTTCNATITADRAEADRNSGTSPTYQAMVNADNADKLVATDSTLAEFQFYGINENSAVGTCALEFVKHTARDLLEYYTQPVLTALNQAFSANTPESMLANLLTEALLPLELGSYTSAQIDFDVQVPEVYSTREEGLVINYATDIIPDLSLSRGYPINRYFSQYDNRFFPIPRSEDKYGYAASSYTSLSTAWLNYLQWAKGFSSILNDTLEFSESELGISDNETLTDTFSGEILKEIHPALGAFAEEQIQVVMFRHFNPFFYIVPDSNQLIPMLGAPLNYFIDDVRVQFKAPDTILNNGDVIKGEVFIELVASLHETDFVLNHNGNHGNVYLDTQVVPDPQFSSLFSKLKLDMIDFDIKDCPKYKHEFGQISNACERQVEGAIRNFLTPALATRLAQLVGDIPAPQFFSLQSEDAQSERQVSPQNRMQANGRVSMSGIFE